MADKKISALTAATTPLAGTEVLPIVQGGVTVKATVANIVGAGTSPGSFTTVNATGNVSTAGTGSKFITAETTSTNGQSVAFRVVAPNSDGSPNSYQVGTGLTADDEWTVRDLTSNQTVDKYVRGASGFRSFWVNGNEYFKINASGNLVVVNSGNGIDFTQDPNPAGMTSELLDDYEEGEWTAAFVPSTSGTITMNNAIGTYTKVGRVVTINALLTVTSVASPLGFLQITGLPFSGGVNAKFRCALAINNENMNATMTTSLVANIQGGAIIYVFKNDGLGSIALTTAADVQAGTNIFVGGTYTTE
jgi:hypothetical protein